MTRNEAYMAMLNGMRITHDSFTEEEFLQMNPHYEKDCWGDASIVDEREHIFTMGWRRSTGEFWEHGWSVWGSTNTVH